ncbi:N-acetylmuramoyl-L-alanine amidase [Pseudoxanthomonas sp. CF125]|uniref:N-acetylmuramoyl-L-alanine amidase n=1 Tax=Pseudoxanthomonas sp. CF125 TaxID=1855303 RepID=UPI000B895FC3|nr:N-acetylmuramoyl-L-alanine amidase [Pseudoxanthomonas sp. CF125]
MARCGASRSIRKPRLWPQAGAALLVALLAGCAHAPPHNPLARWVPSPNHNAREATLIVIHATTQDSVEQSLHTLRTRNSGGPVSSHYLIGRDGALYQLVAEDRRAWHAGPGSWGTISDVNSASIGIELDNNGSEPFPAEQIDKLLVLLEDLCKRLDIPRHQVIAHADMAPTRKTDPGPLFPWARLAQAGFGRWPSAPLADPPANFDPRSALRILGYSMDDYAAAVRAFRLHYRGIDADATELGVEDLRILYALVNITE